MRRQHGVISRAQLLELGFSPKAIEHRIRCGRLHPVARGVYAVGRPDLTQHGRWMAAVLACGPGAVLSHGSAAALWGIAPWRGATHVSVAAGRQPEGVRAHRRALTDIEMTRRQGIPVTSPALTLIDLATQLSRERLERAIDQADALNVITVRALREALRSAPRHPGLKVLRSVIDARTFTLTDSVLERLFLPLAQQAGLPQPLTRHHVSGFKVDFAWPDLKLVVETDSLRYHRTPAQQARDRVRDHAHLAAGLTPVRFTHAQVRFEPGHVVKTLSALARTL